MLRAGYEIRSFFVQVWVFSSSFSSDLQDEICKSIAESGGIDVIFKCIDDSGEHGNKIVARACCSLLSKVQGDSGSEFMVLDFFTEFYLISWQEVIQIKVQL